MCTALSVVSQMIKPKNLFNQLIALLLLAAGKLTIGPLASKNDSSL